MYFANFFFFLNLYGLKNGHRKFFTSHSVLHLKGLQEFFGKMSSGTFNNSWKIPFKDFYSAHKNPLKNSHFKELWKSKKIHVAMLTESLWKTYPEPLKTSQMILNQKSSDALKNFLNVHFEGLYGASKRCIWKKVRRELPKFF